MVCEVKIWWVVNILWLVSCNMQHWVHGEPQVPCFFIFGDSLVDNGNNNGLITLAKVNFPPYGIDFPDGPTGRFSNGRTMADIIAELLGFDNYIPPFATASNQDTLKGVNYASGGAGIRNESGQHLGARISLDFQMRNHQTIVSRIANILGNNDSAAKYLSKCLYSVGMGSNDYINNYYLPNLYPTSHQYTPVQYAQILIQQYTQQIMTLYKYGARKVALMGLGPIGCTPNEIARYGKNGSSCVEDINNSVQLFNSKLISLVDNLNTNLTDAKFIYVNYYAIASSDVSSLGFKVTNSACCGGGKNNGEIPCLPLQIPCKKRSEYLFWDAFHPTEAANVIVAARAYNAHTPSDTYPIDISHLIQL
ncbi:GDSL esterase/lipase At1g29670-like [Cornus florida]|uniref:GDSL esterase/lipase At1g29670-like n=1 Tax=Cornus florida TaxID=4283 RepID=UPI00289FF712|nr:GDSL esterase/lipase At1g29670-like [Cornus florida]